MKVARSSLPPDQEKRLADDLRNGKIEAFRRVVDVYSGLILQKTRLMIGRLSSGHTPEDVAQEIFEKAYLKMQTIRGDRVAPWLLSLTHNHCLDMLQKAKRLPDNVKFNEELAKSPAGEEIPDHLLAALQPLERSVLLMRVLDGLDYKEIAVITGHSAGSLRNMVSKSLQILRKEVSKDGV